MVMAVSFERQQSCGRQLSDSLNDFPPVPRHDGATGNWRFAASPDISYTFVARRSESPTGQAAEAAPTWAV